MSIFKITLNFFSDSEIFLKRKYSYPVWFDYRCSTVTMKNEVTKEPPTFTNADLHVEERKVKVNRN